MKHFHALPLLTMMADVMPNGDAWLNGTAVAWLAFGAVLGGRPTG
jgi:hypothetical protein